MVINVNNIYLVMDEFEPRSFRKHSALVLFVMVIADFRKCSTGFYHDRDISYNIIYRTGYGSMGKWAFSSSLPRLSCF